MRSISLLLVLVAALMLPTPEAYHPVISTNTIPQSLPVM
jgi:hypothetical protein